MPESPGKSALWLSLLCNCLLVVTTTYQAFRPDTPPPRSQVVFHDYGLYAKSNDASESSPYVLGYLTVKNKGNLSAHNVVISIRGIKSEKFLIDAVNPRPFRFERQEDTIHVYVDAIAMGDFAQFRFKELVGLNELEKRQRGTYYFANVVCGEGSSDAVPLNFPMD